MSASGSFGLNTIALTFCEISVRRSDSWPAASVLRWMTVIPEIFVVPSAVPSAFAVQTCSSRKPLPTPPPLEYPIAYGAFPGAGAAS